MVHVQETHDVIELCRGRLCVCVCMCLFVWCGLLRVVKVW